MIKGIGRFAGAHHGYCVVTLCNGKSEGKDFYAFVAIEPQNYPYFKRHYEKNQGNENNFRAYGKELLRGWGNSPSEDILHYVSNKYNIEFDVQPEFIERLVALSESNPFPTSSPVKPARLSSSLLTQT